MRKLDANTRHIALQFIMAAARKHQLPGPFISRQVKSQSQLGKHLRTEHKEKGDRRQSLAKANTMTDPSEQKLREEKQTKD